MDRLGGIFGSRGAYDDEPDYSGPDYSGPDYSGDDSVGPGFDDDTIDAAPPSPVGQDERRMQVRAYNHWASLLADRNFPSIEELDPASLTDFGPYSVLLDFTQEVENPAIAYLGNQLAEECRAQDASDASDAIHAVSEIPARSLLSRITDHYMQILANQAPIGFEAEFVNQRGATALYRGILLPYSSDDETIDFIFGVINWKEVADQQTADELLLEIGQALRADAAADEDTADGEYGGVAHGLLGLQQPAGPDDAPLELSVPVDAADHDGVVPSQDEPHELPVPAFGTGAASFRTDWPAQDWDEDEDEEDSSEVEWRGKPIGETARDYGLDDDYDEPELEDVDDVVDPLADDSVGVGLSALIGRGTRSRPTLELPSAYPAEDAPPVPQAYEPEERQAEVGFVPGAPLSTDGDTPEDGGFDIDPFATDDPDDAPASAHQNNGEYPGENPAEAEGLYDCLAAARELALVASSSEDRSRDALYRAVGRAYDFSLEAAADPEGFEELIADSGLKVQERAPMTPVVKLVFGADYDKTRLTEYAAVLSHAHRLQVERGSLARYLGEAEGGLKGVVQAERRARREEAGETVDDRASVRESLAKKLRGIEPLGFDDLDPEGAEFALVMVRRTGDGELLVVGEIPEDVPLVERAARKLLG